MTMLNDPCRRAISSPLQRLVLTGMLGVLAALLVSCSSSGKGLIPSGNAGPLRHDFEAVSRAAQDGNGSCTATETAIATTEQDFRALPSTVDAGLRNTLRQGIANLHTRALVLCTQPLAQTTTTRTTPSTQTTSSTPTVTQTTTTQTTPTTSTPTNSGPGGGTPAPEASPGEDGAGAGEGGAGAGEGAGAAGGSGPGGAKVKGPKGGK